MYNGIDTSYVQENYTPAYTDFTIINASRGNIGPVVGSWYPTQVNNAFAVKVDIGHYYFNGPNGTIEYQADFYVNNLHDFIRGLHVVALDVEATGTIAWTPEESLTWFTRVGQRLDIPLSTMVIYLNTALLKQYGERWKPLVDAGIRLWYADPSNIGYTAPWPDWTIKQWGISGGVDQNVSKLRLSEIAALPKPPAPPIPFYQRKRKRMPFAFISCNGEISIVYGDGPNAGKRRPLHSAEWSGYAAQGYPAPSVDAKFYAELPVVTA